MKRTAAVVVAVGMVLMPGCRMLDDLPLTTTAFWTGAVIGGLPPVVACAPVTVPLAMNESGWDSFGILCVPGLPTGFLGGALLALPAVVVEMLVKVPMEVIERIANRDTARGAPPPPPAAEPRASTIISYPAGARVLLDGRDVGRTPVAVVFPDRGSVTVSLQLAMGPRHKHEVQRDPHAGSGEGVGWEPAYEFELPGER